MWSHPPEQGDNCGPDAAPTSRRREFFRRAGLKLQGEGVEAAGWNYLPRRTPWRVAQTLGAVLFVAGTRGSREVACAAPHHPARLSGVADIGS